LASQAHELAEEAHALAEEAYKLEAHVLHFMQRDHNRGMQVETCSKREGELGE
jgi:hypothetical protein